MQKQILISNFQHSSPKRTKMSEFANEQASEDSKMVSGCNPFSDHNHQRSEQQVDEGAEYPLCLDTKCPESQNTPLSRLSEMTYKSELHNCNKNWNTSSIGNEKAEQMAKKNLQTIVELKAQVKQLNDSLDDARNYSALLEKRNQELVVALEKQKLKSSHLENAIGILRKGESQLDRKMMQQSELVSQLREEFDREKDKNLSLIQKLQNSQAENNYLKELILIANSNYETLQQKYLTCIDKNKKIEQQNLNKQKQLTHNMQQMKNLLSNLITTPPTSNKLNHNLSFGEQDQNCVRKCPTSVTSRGQKKQVEEIYRKMFIKTLRSKK